MAAITTILRTKKKIKKEKKGQVRKENKYPNELYLRNEETGSEIVNRPSSASFPYLFPHCSRSFSTSNAGSFHILISDAAFGNENRLE